MVINQSLLPNEEIQVLQGPTHVFFVDVCSFLMLNTELMMVKKQQSPVLIMA